MTLSMKKNPNVHLVLMTNQFTVPGGPRGPHGALIGLATSELRARRTGGVEAVERPRSPHRRGGRWDVKRMA
jgi:hypothetical protein